MSAPQTVLTLVENFERNLDAYRSGKYNETQVRRDFIDPLFKALGWDMDNSAGYAEAYRNVIHEDAIKIGTSTKAPDYSFRIGGQRKFFLEAKKPSVNVKDDIEPAFQLRRYAWSAKLPLSIVTDFEEFAIYDCRAKPDKGDKASKARLFYCTFRDYAAKWDEIAAIFSKEAVLKGSFDKYAVGTKGKRGTTEVDSAFLEEIEGWRDLLARNIALRNANLTQRELNFAVQQTIDRIIFLRICEDRGIEPYGKLMALQNGVNVYGRLREMFRDADDRYNSGLFHFKREKGRAEAPDELTLHLEIDDKPLKEIFKNLYYPDCPYEFSVLGADILGSVYEQFLSKVIRLTAGNRAVVEDKPEVKKAGGVFYTPAYIVQYIVEHTVGKLLEGKTPKQAAGIAILDPACGSGSFLIGAYQYLLDWYLARYAEEGAEKHSKGKEARLRHSASGEWRLTTAEKKRILLEHIYGVDIDAQAVEVTKLSLLLKVLEGESDQTLTSQMKLFHERVLPDLDRNIQCGNSLIGPDFYDSQLDLDDKATQRINVFDWQAAFPQIFKAGGFDAVIGNPPYVRPHNIEDDIKSYFWRHYGSFVGKSDLYCCFIERAISLLKKDGKFGNIISNGWLRLDSFEALRKQILAQTSVEKIVDFTDNVFATATVKTCILLLRKGKAKANTIEVAACKAETPWQELPFKIIEQSKFDHTYKCIFDISMVPELEAVKDKMRSLGKPLGEQFDLAFGLKTGDDSKFLTYSPSTDKDKRLLRGEDVHRYSSQFKGEYVHYNPKEMTSHRSTARPGSSERFEQPKVLIRDTGGALEGTFDDDHFYVKDVLVVLDAEKQKKPLKHLMGILNSKLMRVYYETSFPTLHVQRDELASLPVIALNNHPSSASIVALVEKMLALHPQLAAAKTPQDTNLLQRQIDATDKQIDQLVYALYGLTDEEIALVEGA